MFRQRLDLNTDATIQRNSNELNRQIVATSINNWTSNNGNYVDDITLSANGMANPMDMSLLEPSGTARKLFLMGKMNMTSHVDTICFLCSNGIGNFLGQQIRPMLNPIDNMYHFTYLMEGYAKFVRVANLSTSTNDITNLTINYTFLK
tara:strand:+ start:17253 stop:17696 length:444 start_codon:yes stop_codon:yes gene_type:complete